MRCNICRAEDFERLYSNFKKPSARHADYPRDVMICRSCGLVCLDLTDVTAESLEAYYTTSNTFERPSALYEGHRPMREDQVGWILGNLPSGHGVREVLDVGCGAGYVAKLFKDKGLRVWGIDYSPAMVRNLKETWGIDGYQGAFSPEKVERRYDLVSCLCVLEHMLDPNKVIGQFARTLKDGGFLALEVPDVEFPRWDMVPDHVAFDHLYHWTERSMGRMLEQNGFEVVAVKHLLNSPDSGNPEAVLRVLSRTPAHGAARFLGVNDYERQKRVMAEFKQKHNDYLDGFQKKIDAVKAKVGSEPLAVFCAGEHTATLLARFDFSGLKIPFLFDNDPAVAGKSLQGIPIRPGAEARKREVRHYFLSTTNHEKSLYEDLKKMDPDCRVYGLYSRLD